MIPINYEYAFFIYILGWFIYLTILWARESWRTNINDWSLSEGKLCVCEDCGYIFLIKTGESSRKCPKCSSLCFLKKHRF